MSFYTVFDTAETVVTTTSTANLMSPSDPVLIHSTALKRKGQTTIGAVTSLWNAQTAATSTGTVLSAAGVIVVPSTASAGAISYQLADPTQRGQNVFIFQTTTTTTSVTITPISATISGSESTAGTATSVVFKGGPASVELMALSTAAWVVCSRTGSVTCT